MVRGFAPFRLNSRSFHAYQIPPVCRESSRLDGWGSYSWRTMGGKQSRRPIATTKTSYRGALVTKLSGHTDAVLCCSFSHDGRLLATSSADHSIMVWDVKSFKRKYHLKNEHGHTEKVNAICFSPDSSLLLSAGKDGRVILWDSRNGHYLQKARQHQLGITSCAYARDNNHVFATASEDKTVGIWTIEDRKLNMMEVRGHKGAVFQVCFSPDNVTLASCSNDKTIRLWNRRTGKRLAKLKDGYSRVLTCQFSPDGTLIAAVVDGERVRIWDTVRGTVINVLEGHHILPVLSCGFSPDGTMVATGSRDKTMALWDLQEVRKPPDYHCKAHEDCIHCVCFSPSGRYLATCSADKSVCIWIANP